MNIDDTIVALATPPGQSAIAVIRLSGPDCFKVFLKLTTLDSIDKISHKRLLLLKLYRVNSEKNTLIDECIVTAYHAPHSYTGENIIEISTHGSMLIVQLILESLVDAGARFAKAGEFTERAFINGKLDLVQAESIDALIRASTESELSLIHNHYSGHFSNSIKSIRSSFIELLSLIELELDFSEEDVEFASREKLSILLTSTESQLQALYNSFKRSHIIRDGFSVAIIGKPNVGKSSFLNLLLKKERAIVSDIAGTTRDVITEAIDIGGYKFVFSDTAGIHKTEDPIEKEGIFRSKDVIENSELIFMILDASSALTCSDFELKEKYFDEHASVHPRIVFLLNKSDRFSRDNESEYLSFVGNRAFFKISCLDGSGFEKVESFLIEMVQSLTASKTHSATAIINERQKNIIYNALHAVKQAKLNFSNGLTQEYIAADIRVAVNYLSELIGEVSTEDILSNIFMNFCIGK